jgi:hypothetical protein
MLIALVEAPTKPPDNPKLLMLPVSLNQGMSPMASDRAEVMNKLLMLWPSPCIFPVNSLLPCVITENPAPLFQFDVSLASISLLFRIIMVLFQQDIFGTEQQVILFLLK